MRLRVSAHVGHKRFANLQFFSLSRKPSTGGNRERANKTSPVNAKLGQSCQFEGESSQGRDIDIWGSSVHCSRDDEPKDTVH